MKAVDTNIIARFVLDDDPIQSPLATKVMAGQVFVADTVLVETAWLLSSRYGFDRATLAATLADLLQLSTVSVGNAALVDWAIAQFAAGADFADMMHLQSARHADSFVSFEKHLDVLAGAETPLRIERPA